MLVRKIVQIVFILCGFSLVTQASDEPMKVLSPAQWMEQQKTEAQNRLARITNKLKSLELSGQKSNNINRLKSDVRIAEQGFEIAKQLTIEDYFVIYLNPIAGIKGAMEEAVKVISKEEMAELLKIMAKSSSNEAKAKEMQSPFVEQVSSI